MFLSVCCVLNVIAFNTNPKQTLFGLTNKTKRVNFYEVSVNILNNKYHKFFEWKSIWKKYQQLFLVCFFSTKMKIVCRLYFFRICWWSVDGWSFWLKDLLWSSDWELYDWSSKFHVYSKKSFINYLNLRYNFQFGDGVYPEGLKSIILSHPNRWSIYLHIVKNRKSFGFQWF